MRINFGLAALAILISIALWVLVVNDQNPDRTDTPDIAIPVEVSKVPPGLVMMNNPEPVRFKIRAPRDRWTNLRVSGFRASVDLSHVGPGIQAVPVVPEASDPQIRVLEVIPSTASVRLEEVRERTVPVKVNLVGNVPFGYVYSAAKADPEVVVVSGPSSVVQSVEMASVDVRLEGITVTIDAAFHPLPVDSSGASVRNVRMDPQTVRVRLPVDQQVSYKQVGVRAALTGAVASGYWMESVNAEPSSVTVVGDPKLLAKINYLDTAVLNVNGASTSISQDLRIVTPEGVSLVQQQTIRVTVRISPLQASQVVRLAPRLINLDPVLRAVGVPAYLEVTLQGPAPTMQGLRVETLGATLDLADLGEGVQQVRPAIVTPPGVSVVSVQPESVSMMLAPPATPVPTPSAQPTPSEQPTPSSTPSATATPALPR